MVGIIIQARLGSTRLPRKVLLPIDGKPIIAHVFERCLQTGFPVVVAVPEGEGQEFKDVLPNAHVFEGHPTDVLDRYYEVAKAFKFDPIIRITGDCPLIDINIMGQMVTQFKLDGNDGYLSNCHPIRTVPLGLDIEIFSFRLLEKIHCFVHTSPLKNAEEYKEHVTMGMYDYFGDEKIRTYSPPWSIDWKMSVDTQEDYERVKAMIEEGKFPWRN
jgi:spore coat polysaccharide biosynthesis protein SpsF